MDASSQKRLAKVHPELAARVTLVIEELAAKGYDVRVVQGLRTYAEQDGLYAQGRTKPGQRVTNARGGYSNHNFGLAADLCPFIDGEPAWDRSDLFDLIGQTAVKHRLDWGGTWKKFVDKPHVELPTGLKVAQCRTLAAKGLDAVWKRASELAGGKSETGIPASASIILKLGDKGPLVVALQKALGINADGDFGKKTQAAVVAFQGKQGLKADGRAGDNTRKALGLI